MRRNVLLCIVVVVVAINNISPVKAFNGENADRQLRSVQTPTKENHFSGDEERANLKDLAAKVKTDKLDDLAAKAKTGQVDDAIAAAGGNNWQQTLGKMKANNFKNIDDIKAPAINQNMWQAAVAKIQSGKLNKLDTTNSKWKSAFNKLKT
ncbi:RxLR effector protein, partial [Phytophthora megakarya]